MSASSPQAYSSALVADVESAFSTPHWQLPHFHGDCEMCDER